MSTKLKRILFTVFMELVTLPLWHLIASKVVVPKDYVPEGEKGTQMVSELGFIFVLTILIAVSLLLIYTLSTKLIKDQSP